MSKYTFTIPNDRPAVERINWGYWDGKACADRKSFPEWSPKGKKLKHPFDQEYAKGFWAGFEGRSKP